MENIGNVRRKSVSVKEYTLKDLAGIYETSLYLMRKKIAKVKKTLGKREGYFYDTKQVERIFALVPLPSHVDII